MCCECGGGTTAAAVAGAAYDAFCEVDGNCVEPGDEGYTTTLIIWICIGVGLVCLICCGLYCWHKCVRPIPSICFCGCEGGNVEPSKVQMAQTDEEEKVIEV